MIRDVEGAVVDPDRIGEVARDGANLLPIPRDERDARAAAGVDVVDVEVGAQPLVRRSYREPAATFDELTDNGPFAIYVWDLLTHIEHNLAATPLGRLGSTGDVAPLVAWCG